MAARRVILHITAIFSLLAQAALFGIIITIALVELPIERLRPFVLASSTLNGLLVLALLAIVLRISRGPTFTATEHLLFSLSFTLSTTALVLSFYVLGSIWSTYEYKSSSLHTSATASLIVTGLTLCTITLITQTITHLLLLFSARQQDHQQQSPGAFSVNLKSFATTLTSSTTQHTPYTSSINSLHSLKSSRHGSVNQIFGSMGSKTKLIVAHQSIQPSDSESQLSKREPSLEIACRGEVSELYQVSGPYELSSSPPPRMNLKRTMLETIPGSRPVSAAKPLEPYLWDDITPEDFPLPDSPSLSRTTSPVHAGQSSPIADPYHGLPFPPMIGEIASSSQTHIHPLFRSDSPGPPPTVTPGTKLTASPYGGQVLGSDHALAKRFMSSRPTTPARSPTPSVEKFEIVPNFSRPGAGSRNGSRSGDMF